MKPIIRDRRSSKIFFLKALNELLQHTQLMIQNTERSFSASEAFRGSPEKSMATAELLAVKMVSGGRGGERPLKSFSLLSSEAQREVELGVRPGLESSVCVCSQGPGRLQAIINQTISH